MSPNMIDLLPNLKQEPSSQQLQIPPANPQVQAIQAEKSGLRDSNVNTPDPSEGHSSTHTDEVWSSDEEHHSRVRLV